MLVKSVAVAGFVHAAVAALSLSNLCSVHTTITAASAISALNACPTLDGQIEITGNELPMIDLSGVRSIAGDVKLFNSTSVQAISFSGLGNVTGLLEVSALTQLHNIDFNTLTKAEQLQFVSLPSLAMLNLNSGLATVNSLTLLDTAISNIDNLLKFDTIATLNVNNNKNITLIDLSGLETVTEGLTISFNLDNATVHLDNLIWALNLTIQDVGDLSIGLLRKVNGSFVLAYNGFDSLEFEQLSTVGASLQVFANDELTSLALLNLSSVTGDIRVFNNTQLKEVELNLLLTIKGAWYMKGPFGNMTIPKLKEVDGDFTMASTSDKFSCKAFDKLHDDNKIKGHNYNCLAPPPPLLLLLKLLKLSSLGALELGSATLGLTSSAATTSKAGKSKKSGGVYLYPGVLSSMVGTVFALLI